MSQITYKINSLSNVPFAGTCRLVDDSLKTNSNQTITFPSSGGTLATTDDIDGLSSTYLTQTDASTTYLTQTSASSTYATQSSLTTTNGNVSTLTTKMNNLLDYLESWANAGNLSMSDIKSAVNGSGSS